MILARITPSRLMAQLVSSHEDSIARMVNMGAKVAQNAGPRPAARLFTPDRHHRIHPGGNKGGNNTGRYTGEQADKNGQQYNIQWNKNVKNQEGREYYPQNKNNHQPDQPP